MARHGSTRKRPTLPEQAADKAREAVAKSRPARGDLPAQASSKARPSRGRKDRQNPFAGIGKR